LDINFEYKRKSIRSRDIKVASISMVREQAQDMGLFDKSKRYVNINLNEIKEEDIQDAKNNDKCSVIKENFEDSLDNKISANKQEPEDQLPEKFVIDIPSNAVKQDLHDLKIFLSKQES
jgi:hypothetical protein